MFKLAVFTSQFKNIYNLIKSKYMPVSILIVMSIVYERVIVVIFTVENNVSKFPKYAVTGVLSRKVFHRAIY